MEIVGVYERVLVGVGVLETYPATTLRSQKQWQHGVRVPVQYRLIYGGVVLVRQPVVSLPEQASVRIVCVGGEEQLNVGPVVCRVCVSAKWRRRAYSCRISRVCELGEILKYALHVSGFMFSG